MKRQARTSARARAVDRCRICGSVGMVRYLDMGRTPLANSYLAGKDVDSPEFTEELCLQLCRECGLSQLTRVVPPDRMFRHYLYVSSTTATMREHFAGLARAAVRAAGARPGELALDIASNDGCLLNAFRDEGLQVLGVDPAENLAREANAKGIRTECAYWSKGLAQKLARSAGRPAIITAANVFAHVDDLHDFLKGVSEALAPRGVFIIECPYVVDFLEKSEFDTAYHEHLSYMGVSPLSSLMAMHDFEVFDVERFEDIHGGTIRVYCARKGEHERSRNVARFLAREESFGMQKPGTYKAFAKRVLDNRKDLRSCISDLAAKGRVVWAYGASAKGNTLMNFFGLKANQVPVVIDDNPKKWGLFTPGAHMRIVGIDALRDARVDFLLLLAWNFEKEIRARCRVAGYKGGFILPVPRVSVKSGGRGRRAPVEGCLR